MTTSEHQRKPSIREVLGFYGAEIADLPSHGGWTPTLCPFHEDRTKSASIHPEWEAFNCHTCRVSGDSWKIIMEREGIGFAAAARFAEEQFGHSGDHVQRSTVQRRKQYRPSWT